MAQFRMPVGTGGGCKYVKLAEANASQTYKAQLTQLKATYDLLTDEDKMRCVVIIASGVYIICDLIGRFQRHIVNNSGTSRTTFVDMDSLYAYQYDINSSGSVTSSALTNTSNTSSMSLWILAS